jgi:hypothetical protein
MPCALHKAMASTTGAALIRRASAFERYQHFSRMKMPGANPRNLHMAELSRRFVCIALFEKNARDDLHVDWRDFKI